MLFFSENNTIPAKMLQIGAISVVFFCLSTVTNAVLQSINDMMTPVKNAAISLLIHVISLLLMLVVFKWNIYGVVVSKIVFAGAICILNAHSLRERIGYVQERKKTFIIPIIASVIMGIVAIVVHLLGILFLTPLIATLLALLFAVMTYIVALLLLGGLREDEILEMPKGAKLAKLFRKLHLLN
jgi:stage V sporulation protein B